MSTYYYLVCDDHRVSSEVIGSCLTLGTWRPGETSALETFLADHANCTPAPRLLSEHAGETEEYERPYKQDGA